MQPTRTPEARPGIPFHHPAPNERAGAFLGAIEGIVVALPDRQRSDDNCKQP